MLEFPSGEKEQNPESCKRHGNFKTACPFSFSLSLLQKKTTNKKQTPKLDTRNNSKVLPIRE